MSIKYTTRTTRWEMHPEDDPFADSLLLIEVVDDGAGAFVKLSQPCGPKDGAVCIDPEEWSELKAAIDAAFADITKYESTLALNTSARCAKTECRTSETRK